MAKLSFPTARIIALPLLIDANQLEGLDRIVDRHMDALREYREREVELATEREIQKRLARGWLKEEQIAARRPYISTLATSRLQKDSRSATLYLRGGKEVQAERFSEAMIQPVGEHEIATTEPAAHSRITTRDRIELRPRRACVGLRGPILDISRDRCCGADCDCSFALKFA